MSTTEGTIVLGRTVQSMRKARSRYDDSILWAEEANLLMLYVLERIQRIKKAGVGGSWEMLLKELREVCDQMLVENPTLIAKLAELPELVLPDREEEPIASGKSRNGTKAEQARTKTSYGLFFASVKALRDAFMASSKVDPADFLRNLDGRGAGGMQAVVYKLWYMRHSVPYEGMVPNQRSEEVGRDLNITDDIRWKAIVDACVGAGYISEPEGHKLLDTRPATA